MDGVDFTAWCSLRNEALMAPSSDLLLKHGVGVPGKCKFVSTLNAMQEPSVEIDPLDPMGAFTPALEINPPPNPIGIMLKQPPNSAHSFLGRPPAAYGIPRF